LGDTVYNFASCTTHAKCNNDRANRGTEKQRKTKNRFDRPRFSVDRSRRNTFTNRKSDRETMLTGNRPSLEPTVA